MTGRTIDAEVVLRLGSELGEGPVWDEQTHTLLFVDIDGGFVHRFDVAAGTLASFSSSEPVGSLGLRDDGGLIMARGASFARCGPAGEDLELVGDFSADQARVRFNDGKVDPWGRFVAGTLALDGSSPVGALYRLETDGKVTTLLEDVTTSNGLAWTTDYAHLYYVDSATRGVDIFDLEPSDGTMLRRRRLVDIGGPDAGPDGIAVDVEDCVWVACWGLSCVRRYTPTGTLDREVRVPTSHVTSVAFGGENLDDIYITSARKGLSAGDIASQPRAGDLFIAHVGVEGAKVSRFG